MLHSCAVVLFLYISEILALMKAAYFLKDILSYTFKDPTSSATIVAFTRKSESHYIGIEAL